MFKVIDGKRHAHYEDDPLIEAAIESLLGWHEQHDALTEFAFAELVEQLVVDLKAARKREHRHD